MTDTLQVQFFALRKQRSQDLNIMFSWGFLTSTQNSHMIPFVDPIMTVSLILDYFNYLVSE